MMWEPDICVYHDPCQDGFAAALAIYERFGDAVKYIGWNYNRGLPDGDFADKRVLVVDFSFKGNDLEALASSAHSVVMLDHHKTAMADLAGMGFLNRLDVSAVQQHLDCQQSNVLVHFDMDQSGAMMAWRFCFPDRHVPRLIQYVQDRDLWRFALHGTKEVHYYLKSLPMQMRDWQIAMALIEEDHQQVLVIGSGMERYARRLIENICDAAEVDSIAGYQGVPVTHICPYDLVSEVCKELLRRHPDAPFAAAVLRTHGGITVSMRSEEGREDVSVIAKENGGGGHRNAAGFRQ